MVWIKDLMSSWFDVKFRRMLGEDARDDREVVILGRVVKWTTGGITYEADPKHRRMFLEYFGFDQGSRPLGSNGWG